MASKSREQQKPISDRDRLRWVAENGSALRSRENGRLNALVWYQTGDGYDRLNALRVHIDHAIRSERKRDDSRVEGKRGKRGKSENGTGLVRLEGV